MEQKKPADQQQNTGQGAARPNPLGRGSLSTEEAVSFALKNPELTASILRNWLKEGDK